MITISEVAGGAVLRTPGEFRVSDMIETKRALATRFADGVSWLFIIVDLSEATSMDAQTSEIETLVAQDRILAALTRSGLPFAVIAPHDSYFGVARMWQAICDDIDWEIKIFRGRALAEAWIRDRVAQKFGVTLPPFDPAAA